jgi:hypothetical protein
MVGLELNNILCDSDNLLDFTCEDDEFCASALILNAWAENGSKGVDD